MDQKEFSKEVFYTVIADTLGLPKSFKILPTMRTEDVPGWDSLGWLKITGAIEDRWGIEFPLENLLDISNVEEFENATKELVSKA